MRFPHLFAIPADITGDRRYLLILLGAAFLIGQYDMALLSLVLPDVQATFAIPEEDLGRMIAVARLGALPALLLTMLADNTGRRLMLIVSLLGVSVAATASGFAQSATQFMLLQCAARLFVTLDEILAVTLALEMLPKNRRGWGVGFISALGGLGAGLGALLYGSVEHFPGGWRTLYIMGGIAVLGVAWMRRKLPESAMFEAGSASGRQRDFLAPVLQIFREHRGEAIIVCAIALLFWFPVIAALNFMSKFLQEIHQYTPGEVSTLFLVAGTVAIFGNVIAGRLSDRYGRRPMLALAVLVNSCAFFVFYNTSFQLLIPVAWVFALFCYFAGEVIVSAISGELFPTSCRSTASMLRSIAGIVGSALGLVTESQLYELLGSHAAALSLMVLVSLLAMPVILLFLRETSGQSLQ